MRSVLVFDGDCGFCTASADVIRNRIRPRCDVQPWQLLDLAALGLTPSACQEAVQFVGPAGEVASGSRAITAMLRTASPPWPFAAGMIDQPFIAVLADRTYRWVARHRHRLPGSTPACAVRASDS